MSEFASLPEGDDPGTWISWTTILSSKGLGGKRRVVMHGEKDETGIGELLQDLGPSLEAVEPRHGDVQNDHVGAKL